MRRSPGASTGGALPATRARPGCTATPFLTVYPCAPFASAYDLPPPLRGDMARWPSGCSSASACHSWHGRLSTLPDPFGRSAPTVGVLFPSRPLHRGAPRHGLASRARVHFGQGRVGTTRMSFTDTSPSRQIVGRDRQLTSGYSSTSTCSGSHRYHRRSHSHIINTASSTHLLGPVRPQRGAQADSPPRCAAPGAAGLEMLNRLQKRRRVRTD